MRAPHLASLSLGPATAYGSGSWLVGPLPEEAAGTRAQAQGCSSGALVKALISCFAAPPRPPEVVPKWHSQLAASVAGSEVGVDRPVSCRPPHPRALRTQGVSCSRPLSFMTFCHSHCERL